MSSVAHKLNYRIRLAINETERSILGCLNLGLREPDGVAILSIRSLSQMTDLSEQTVRRSCRSLAEKGLISISSMTREDGSRSANEYRITVVGRKVLESEPIPSSALIPEHRRG